jgi:hypothetical protein
MCSAVQCKVGITQSTSSVTSSHQANFKALIPPPQGGNQCVPNFAHSLLVPQGSFSAVLESQ